MSRPLRRLLKFFLWFAGAVLVLLLAVRTLVPADRLAAIIAERIEVATGGTAGFAGAEVDVWPGLRLVLKDGAIVGTGEALAARSGATTDLVSYTARIERLEVSLAWGPLLKRRVELGKVRLVSPRIELVTRSPEPAATGAGMPSAAAGRAAPTPVVLFVAGLEVEHGELDWSDDAGERRVRVEGWDQRVGIGDATLLIERLTAFSDRRPAPGSGVPASTLDLRTGIAAMTLEGFHEKGPQVYRDLDLIGTLEVPPEADTLQLKLRRLTWSGVSVTATGAVVRTLEGDRLRGQWHLTDLEVETLRAGLPDVLPGLEPEQADWLAETPLSLGSVAARGDFDLSWPLPQAARYRDLAPGLSATAEVRDLEVVPPRQVMPWRASAALELNGPVAELRDVSVRLGEERPDGGRLDGAATIGDLHRERALCSFTLIARDMPARALLDAVAPVATPYVEGDADLEMAGRLQLGTPEEIRDSLVLAGDVVLSDGVVHAESWLEDISPYLGARQDLKDIRYRHLVHKLRVDEGRLHLDDLMVDGHDTDWRGGGWLGLDGGIDMRLDVKLPEGFTPDLGDLALLAEVLRGDDGRIALGMTLRGRAASPTVALDLAPARQRAQSRIEDGIKGFLDKLKGNE